MRGQARVRLRQAVLVARELDPVAAALRRALGLGEPFRDPGVAEFGLTNAVFALGDCFLEVIAPTREDAPAARYLEHHGGGGGYMVIFDLEDLAGARERARILGVRTVWQIDLPDISGTHLHPADMRGAIVSIDSSRPYGSWRWGGPAWTGRIGPAGPGGLAGVTVAVHDPQGVAERWGEILGVPVGERDGLARLALDGGDVSFRGGPHANGLVEIQIEPPPGLADTGDCFELGGVRLELRKAPAGAR